MFFSVLLQIRTDGEQSFRSLVKWSKVDLCTELPRLRSPCRQKNLLLPARDNGPMRNVEKEQTMSTGIPHFPLSFRIVYSPSPIILGFTNFIIPSVQYTTDDDSFFLFLKLENTFVQSICGVSLPSPSTLKISSVSCLPIDFQSLFIILFFRVAFALSRNHNSYHHNASRGILSPIPCVSFIAS